MYWRTEGFPLISYEIPTSGVKSVFENFDNRAFSEINNDFLAVFSRRFSWILPSSALRLHVAPRRVALIHAFFFSGCCLSIIVLSSPLKMHFHAPRNIVHINHVCPLAVSVVLITTFRRNIHPSTALPSESISFITISNPSPTVRNHSLGMLTKSRAQPGIAK